MSNIMANEKPNDELRPFLSEFIQDRNAELDSLRELVASLDRAGAGKVVHAWKGYSAPYGFGSLPELGAELLKAIDGRDFDLAKELLASIEDYLKQKQAQINDE